MMENKIPCLDLKKQHQSIKKEIFEAFEKVYEKTAFSGGPFVEEFEKNFSLFCGVERTACVSSPCNACFRYRAW